MMGEIVSHMWQSTLFAGAAALLTLAFRENQARVRYWIWLTASLKFLVPFALLTSLGSQVHIAPLPAVKNIAAVTPMFAYPVSLPQIASPTEATSEPASASRADLLIPLVWACGVICLAWIRLRGWRRIRHVMRAGVAIDLPVPVEVRSSPGLSEPGVVGVIRPVLLLPQGITERLSCPELNAVLAHELCHVRRRDNLAAFLHMVVETVFWFHPGVWWIGSRLIEERERACDQDVLSGGTLPEVYADAILSVSKLYMESPRVCACGMTGASLKRRLELIMRNGGAEKLNRARKLLLAAAGAVAVAVPLGIGVMYGGAREASAAPFAPQSQSASFEVASVKPSTEPAMDQVYCFDSCTFGERLSVTGSRVSIRYMSLYNLILTAFRIRPNQLSGPDWMKSERFDIMATIPEGESKNQVPEMLQTLLAERFGLAIHRDRKEQPVLALVVDSKGLKLRKVDASVADEPIPDAERSLQAYTHSEPAQPMDSGDLVVSNAFYGTLRGGRGADGRMQFDFERLSMPALASLLVPHVDRPVVDETNLKGTYRLVFQNTRVSEAGGASLKTAGPPQEPGAADRGARNDTYGEGLIRAIEKGGLKLEPRKSPVEIIVVDHLEKSPTAN